MLVQLQPASKGAAKGAAWQEQHFMRFTQFTSLGRLLVIGLHLGSAISSCWELVEGETPASGAGNSAGPGVAGHMTLCCGSDTNTRGRHDMQVRL